MDNPGSDKLRMMAHRAGQLIMLAALGFLIWELSRQWDQVSDWRPTWAQIVAVILTAIAYGAAAMLTAFNWATILQAVTKERLPHRQLLLSFTKTQIAKYLPGNVLHVVGRHLYAKNLGVAHGPVAKAALLEIVSLPIAAVLAISITLLFVGPLVIGPVTQTFGLATALLAMALIVAVVLWRIKPLLVGTVTLVIGRAIAFMLALGLLFTILLFALSGQFLGAAIPAAILAWLVGFLTPGAPGGMAVREVILINLLGGILPADSILIAALMFRVVTILGDLLVYAIGSPLISHFGDVTGDLPSS